ncbi:MAG: hypothetical protein ABI451_07580 [Dokdonella sp.]
MREVFDDADDTQLAQSSWLVSQLMFAAGDVSSGSMSADDSGATSVYRHCLRLTNQCLIKCRNRNDSVLDISNVKRLGVAPRVGRIGLPSDSPRMAVNVDCTDYYALLASDKKVQKADKPLGSAGAQSHSWYFGNAIFSRDVFHTVIGIENGQRTTRVVGEDGMLRLAREMG